VRIEGDVGALAGAGDIQQKGVQTKGQADEKKPFLKRTSTIVSIAAGLVAILTGTGIWQFFFKPNKEQNMQEPQRVEQPAIPDSTSSQVVQKPEQDTTQTAVKVQ